MTGHPWSHCTLQPTRGTVASHFYSWIRRKLCLPSTLLNLVMLSNSQQIYRCVCLTQHKETAVQSPTRHFFPANSLESILVSAEAFPYNNFLAFTVRAASQKQQSLFSISESQELRVTNWPLWAVIYIAPISTAFGESLNRVCHLQLSRPSTKWGGVWLCKAMLDVSYSWLTELHPHSIK